jgi:hypothetical protein
LETPPCASAPPASPASGWPLLARALGLAADRGSSLPPPARASCPASPRGPAIPPRLNWAPGPAFALALGGSPALRAWLGASIRARPPLSRDPRAFGVASWPRWNRMGACPRAFRWWPGPGDIVAGRWRCPAAWLRCGRSRAAALLLAWNTLGLLEHRAQLRSAQCQILWCTTPHARRGFATMGAFPYSTLALFVVPLVLTHPRAGLSSRLRSDGYADSGAGVVGFHAPSCWPSIIPILVSPACCTAGHRRLRRDRWNRPLGVITAWSPPSSWLRRGQQAGGGPPFGEVEEAWCKPSR